MLSYIIDSSIQTYIYVNIAGNYFRFVDVPGDGDCFHHSVLKNSNMSNRFKDVEELRLYLSSMVLCSFHNDELLQKIFQSYRIDYNSWDTYITNMHEWAKQLDILVFSYIMKFNVISVGNYSNGFILNNMQSYLNQMLRLEENNILENDTVYVYFHNIGRPLEKMTNGNHFAYLEPIAVPNLIIATNTIVANSNLLNNVQEHDYEHEHANKEREWEREQERVVR